jgi:hypothetical protein
MSLMVNVSVAMVVAVVVLVVPCNELQVVNVEVSGRGAFVQISSANDQNRNSDTWCCTVNRPTSLKFQFKSSQGVNLTRAGV